MTDDITSCFRCWPWSCRVCCFPVGFQFLFWFSLSSLSFPSLHFGMENFTLCPCILKVRNFKILFYRESQLSFVLSSETDRLNALLIMGRSWAFKDQGRKVWSTVVCLNVNLTRSRLVMLNSDCHLGWIWNQPRVTLLRMYERSNWGEMNTWKQVALLHGRGCQTD